jgi:hypothetical protein
MVAVEDREPTNHWAIFNGKAIAGSTLRRILEYVYSRFQQAPKRNLTWEHQALKNLDRYSLWHPAKGQMQLSFRELALTRLPPVSKAS